MASLASSRAALYCKSDEARISRSCVMLGALPKVRLSEACEAIHESMDATTTSGLSGDGLARLIWLLTRQRPMTKLSELRVEYFYELNMKLSKRHERLLTTSQSGNMADVLRALQEQEDCLTDEWVLALATECGYKTEWDATWVAAKKKAKKAAPPPPTRTMPELLEQSAMTAKAKPKAMTSFVPPTWPRRAGENILLPAANKAPPAKAGLGSSRSSPAVPSPPVPQLARPRQPPIIAMSQTQPPPQPAMTSTVPSTVPSTMPSTTPSTMQSKAGPPPPPRSVAVTMSNRPLDRAPATALALEDQPRILQEQDQDPGLKRN
ncbi:unnamed protein product [Effrenium voratum]|nr:unnamed protein product [Effrenium voratum]